MRRHALVVVAALALSAPLADAQISPPVMGTWTEKFSPGRADAPTAFDPVHRRWMAIGGVNPYGMSTATEFALDDPEAHWQLASEGPASLRLRIYATVVRDSRRDRYLHFAGTGPYNDPYNELWEFRRDPEPTWTRIATEGDGPPPIFAHHAAYDSTGDAMYVFGGARTLHNVLWKLSFAEPTPTWTVIELLSYPNFFAGEGAVMAVDEAARRLILAGGSRTDFDDIPKIWELPLDGPAEWQEIVPAGEPPRDRGRYAATFDPVSRRVFFVAEALPELPRLDIWELDLSGTPVWRALVANSPTPPAREFPSLVFDPIENELWLSYGLVPQDDGTTVYANDVWSGVVGTDITWTGHGQVDEPSARDGFVTGWDTERSRLIVSGGYSLVAHTPVSRYSSYPRDVWALERTPDLTWRRLATTGGGPVKLQYDAAVIDSVRDRLVVFDLDADMLQEPLVWELSLEEPHVWEPITFPYDFPSRRVAASVIHDPAHDRVLLFGGLDLERGEFGEPADDLWEFRFSPNPGWHRLEPPGARPPARYGATLVHDTHLGRGVLIGGATKLGFERGAIDDVWDLVLDDVPYWLPVDPEGTTPFARSFALGAYDAANRRVVLYSGENQNAYHRDAWVLERNGTPRWRFVLTFDGAPIPRAMGGAAFDPALGRFLIFGGDSGDLDQGDVWELAIEASKPPPTSGVASVSNAIARPTPATGPVAIEFTTERALAARVDVHDIRGRIVRTWDLGTLEPGRQSLLWDGLDADGRQVAAGVYFVRIEGDGAVLATRRVVQIPN